MTLAAMEWNAITGKHSKAEGQKSRSPNQLKGTLCAAMCKNRQINFYSLEDFA